MLGPATRTHTIYEHIEVVVHPLGVHLTEAVAASFWVSTCSCQAYTGRYLLRYFANDS